MSTYKIIFTVKQVIHPMTEVVNASSIEEATKIIKNLIKGHNLSVKQIVSIIEI